MKLYTQGKAIWLALKSYFNCCDPRRKFSPVETSNQVEKFHIFYGNNCFKRKNLHNEDYWIQKTPFGGECLNSTLFLNRMKFQRTLCNIHKNKPKIYWRNWDAFSFSKSAKKQTPVKWRTSKILSSLNKLET